jgi:hypothetical protein
MGSYGDRWSRQVLHKCPSSSQPIRKVLKWFHQNVSKPGDQGIILKEEFYEAVSLNLISKRALDVTGVEELIPHVWAIGGHIEGSLKLEEIAL